MVFSIPQFDSLIFRANKNPILILTLLRTDRASTELNLLRDEEFLGVKLEIFLLGKLHELLQLLLQVFQGCSVQQEVIHVLEDGELGIQPGVPICQDVP